MRHRHASKATCPPKPWRRRKQSIVRLAEAWMASSLSLLAMTREPALTLLLLAVLLLTLAVLASAVREARIAEPGTDGEHAPALDVLHEGHFGEALHHAVIMHED